MRHYVMLFRTTRPFTAEEQPTRSRDIQRWVAQVTSMNIPLDPRNLGETVANLPQAGGVTVSQRDPTYQTGPTDAGLATLVYFDARDHAEALEVARTHPGPRYGVTLELREWSAPAPVTRP